MHKKTSGFNIIRFIYDFEDQLEELSIRYKNELWDWYGGKPGSRLKELENQMLSVMTNTALLQQIEASEPHADDFQKRKLFLLKTEIRRTLIEQNADVLNTIQRIQEALRHSVRTNGGEDISILDLNRRLSVEADSGQRRELYQSIGRFSETLIPAWKELIHLRNQAARSRGYADYADYKMTTAEITPERFDDILQAQEWASDTTYAAWVEEALCATGAPDLMPSDFQYLYRQFSVTRDRFRFPPETARQAVWDGLEAMGFSLEDSGMVTADAGEDFPSLVIPVRIPTDIRMFVGSAPEWDAFTAMIREYGRALHYCYISQNGYILKGVSPALSNAVAELFAEMLIQKPLLDTLGIADAEAVLRYYRISETLQLRMMMTLAAFERFLYTGDPDEAAERWVTLTGRYLRFAGTDKTDWCLQQSLLSRPFSATEWVLAHTIKSQLYERLRHSDRNAWGAILKTHLLEWGSALPWYALLDRFPSVPSAQGGE